MQPPLAVRRRLLQSLADPRTRVARRDSTGITGINSVSECGQLRLVFPFLSLKSPQSGSHHFTGIFVSATLYFRHNKPVQLVG